MTGTLYFAYGSNLRAAHMERLCPGHGFVGIARLPDHRLAFTLPDDEWRGGVADVLPSPGSEVWGALYRLKAAHFPALDTYEGFDPHGPDDANAYVRRTVRIETAPGSALDGVWCYFVRRPRGHVTPSELYRRALLDGADERALPAHYKESMHRAFDGA